MKSSCAYTSTPIITSQSTIGKGKASCMEHSAMSNQINIQDLGSLGEQKCKVFKKLINPNFTYYWHRFCWELSHYAFRGIDWHPEPCQSEINKLFHYLFTKIFLNIFIHYQITISLVFLCVISLVLSDSQKILSLSLSLLNLESDCCCWAKQKNADDIRNWPRYKARGPCHQHIMEIIDCHVLFHRTHQPLIWCSVTTSTPIHISPLHDCKRSPKWFHVYEDHNCGALGNLEPLFLFRYG